MYFPLVELKNLGAGHLRDCPANRLGPEDRAQAFPARTAFRSVPAAAAGTTPAGPLQALPALTGRRLSEIARTVPVAGGRRTGLCRRLHRGISSRDD